MNAKALLIPIAAFAVTVTGVYAFNEEVLEKAGLSDEQISAFEEAHELRMDGDRNGARDVLLDAGIDFETMQNIREVHHEFMHKHREAIDEAIENEDYEVFLEAIQGSPLADIIQTEDDFSLFVAAHQFREAGEHDEAHAILDELGFEPPKGRSGHRHHHHGHFDKDSES